MLYASLNSAPNFIPDGKGGQVLFSYPFMPRADSADPHGIASMLASQRAGVPMETLQACSADLRDAVLRMLTVDEKRRPSAKEALLLPWLSKASDDRKVLMDAEDVTVLTHQAEECSWWRAMTTAAASHMSLSHLEDTNILQLFSSIDTKQNGFIETSDLVRALVEVGVPESLAKESAQAADYDNSGQIEWSEFIAAMFPASQDLFAKGLQMAFAHFDTSNDGHLDRQEIAELLHSGQISHSHCMPEHQTVDEMIASMDLDGDGKISWAEFRDYFVKAKRLSRKRTSHNHAEPLSPRHC